MMWWVETLRWMGAALVIIWGSFVVWRRMRPEYPEEDILSQLVWLAGAGVAGSLVSGWVSVWGMILAVSGVLWWQTKGREWDFWEWGDVVGSLSLWLGAALSGLIGRGWLTGGVLLAGALAVGAVGRIYRRFKWYKSGKLGFVFLTSLVMWAVVEIGVETVGPRTIYWAGLTVSQWLAVVTIVIVTTIGYLRSGQTLAESIWRKLKSKNLR